MSTRICRAVLSLVLSGALMLMAIPSQALASTPDVSADVQIAADLVAKFDPFISYSERSGYTLTGLPKNVTKAEVRAVQTQLAETNKWVNNLRALNRRGDGAAFVQDGTVGILSGSGSNYVVQYWWGYDMYFDNASTVELTYAIAQGAGAMTIGSIIVACFPGGVVPGAIGAVAATLVGMGAAAIGYTNQGNGVIIRFYFGVPMQVFPR